METNNNQEHEPRKPSKAVAYERLNSKEQSFEAQENEIREYCQQQGIELVKVFREYAPGSTLDRPELMELQRYAAENEDVDAVVVVDLSRLSRKPSDMEVIINRLRFCGVSVHSVRKPLDFDTN